MEVKKVAGRKVKKVAGRELSFVLKLRSVVKALIHQALIHKSKFVFEDNFNIFQ